MLDQKIKLPSCNLGMQIDQVTAFLKEHGGNHASHLIFLQDKKVYWAQEQKVLIIYKKIANKLVVLGDPIGEEAYLNAAIKEFYAYSENNGLKAIFYQISPRFMHHYHDSGYRFLKLGEEGKLNLENFSLLGKRAGKLRTSLNKFTRNGYSLQIVQPPYSAGLLAELKRVSDSWLGEQKEKGFSVAAFSEDYVSRFPIALISDSDGHAVAFATLASDYKTSLIIDLMRKTADSPPGTMDVLFVHIFNWAKEKGYHTCSLGMAPLANVGNCKHAFLREKMIHLIYQHGNAHYNFKGLKEFKSKFACSWEPKYLAYKKSFLPATMIHLLLLINNQQKVTRRIKLKYKLKKTG